MCDEAVGKTAVIAVSDWLDAQPNWQVTDLFTSPICGGDGNRENILTAGKTP